MNSNKGITTDSKGLLRLANLSNFVAVDAGTERNTAVKVSLQFLRNFDASAYDTIQRHTHSLIWVQVIDKSKPTQLFSSTTFHTPLGVTFLTDLSLRYIPPDVVFSSTSCFALAENLYHEALHQQLYHFIDNHEVLHPSVRGEKGGDIFIPWRNVHWKLEHALHAYYVYVHIARLRAMADAHFELHRATRGANDAVEQLASSIDAFKECFLQDGRKLLVTLKKMTEEKF